MKSDSLVKFVFAGLLSGSACLAGVFAHEGGKSAFTPDAIPYGPAPAFVAPGAQLAVLEEHVAGHHLR